MESPTRSKAVLELGKRLVAELELGEDLLARWMAHDIAARIDAAERASPAVLTSARDECAKSILALWEHRNELPPHLRAFRELEPLIRTIVALDVDDGDDYRYFRPTLKDAALEDADGPTKEWLDLAFGLDYSARVLVQYALRSAGASAASKAKPWVQAALNAEADPIAERYVVEFVLGDSRKADDAKRIFQESLRNKITKLQSFSRLATAVAAELQLQLEHAPSIENDNSGTPADLPE